MNVRRVCENCTEHIRTNWQKNHSHRNLEDNFIKVTFKDETFKEHIWCLVLNDKGKTLLVSVSNDPVALTHIKDKDIVTIKRKDILQHFNDNDFSFEQSEEDKLSNLKLNNCGAHSKAN